MARIFRLELALSLCFSFAFLVFWAAPTRAQDLGAAEKALKEKNYDKVIEILGPNVEKLKRDGLHLLAEAYSQKDNSLSAIKLYEAALALNPKDASSKRKIGLEYIKMKKEKEALLALREAIEMNPKYEPAYLDMARILEKREENKKDKPNRYDIRLLYEDLIAKVGEKPEYVTKLCELTTLDGQYTLSKQHCPKGIELNNKEPNNYVYLAMTYRDTGDQDKALKYFTKAADSFPKSELAQLSLADFYVEQKNFMKAYVYYKRSTEADESSIPGLYGLARSSLEIQKYEDAYQALTKACKINRSASMEVRKALKSVNQQKSPEWSTKFDQLLDSCGLSAE